MNKAVLGLTLLGLTGLMLFTAGCEEEEDNTIAKAQQCFNKATSRTEAQACLNQLAGIDTPEANSLKCGMAFMVGGIDDTKMLTAFDSFDNASDADKESTLMNLLVVTDSGGVNPDSTQAAEAYNYCKNSGSAGLLYIGTIANAATVMEDVTAGDGSANDIVDNCNGNTTCEATIGELIVTMNSEYCTGESAENDICQAAAAAIAAGGGDYQLIGDQFLDQIDPVP